MDELFFISIIICDDLNECIWNLASIITLTSKDTFINFIYSNLFIKRVIYKFWVLGDVISKGKNPRLHDEDKNNLKKLKLY